MSIVVGVLVGPTLVLVILISLVRMARKNWRNLDQWTRESIDAVTRAELLIYDPNLFLGESDDADELRRHSSALRLAVDFAKGVDWELLERVEKAATSVEMRLGRTWVAECTGCGATSYGHETKRSAIQDALRTHDSERKWPQAKATCPRDGNIRAWERGNRPRLTTPAAAPTPEKPKLDPAAAVGHVRDRIGALRTDIAWVIENPAFFDVEHPASAALFQALGEWDDTRGKRDAERTEKLAREIVLHFTDAKSKAEQVGLAHLHGETRSKVETAAKLVRKAESTASDAEKAQLMRKASGLLADIIDVIAPPETVRALEAHTRNRQIEP